MRNQSLLKSHVSGIRVKRIRVNQGVGVIGILIGIYTWLCLFFSRKSFGRYGSFSSLKRYTSKTSLLSAYDFIKEKVVPDSMRKKPDETKLRLVVAFFFLVIVFVISLAQILYIQHKGEVSKLMVFYFQNCSDLPWEKMFSNESCMFLNPNIFLQFKF